MAGAEGPVLDFDPGLGKGGVEPHGFFELLISLGAATGYREAQPQFVTGACRLGVSTGEFNEDGQGLYRAVLSAQR